MSDAKDSAADQADAATETSAAGEEIPAVSHEATESEERSEPAPAKNGAAVGIVAPIAMLLSLLAAGTAGVLWWQYRSFYVELNDTDRAQTESLQDVRARMRELSDLLVDGFDSARTDQQALERRARELEDDLDALQPGLAAVNRRVDALQGGNLDARSLWLRAEAEYYLATANTELILAGRWQNAIAALELADGILRQLGNPSLAPVRAAIADELNALRAVSIPDVDGIAFSLASLAERVPQLALRGGPDANYEYDAADLDEVEPGLGRLWSGLKGAVLGIVRVERREGPVDVVLSEAEVRVLRRQLTLELELARIALVRAEPDAFRASIVAAYSMLQSEFATGDSDVESAARLLADLESVEIDPRKPDISGSLNLLRELGATN
jgi:uroporphyrin-3 C-methyltransferase